MWRPGHFWPRGDTSQTWAERGAHNWSSVKTAACLDAGQDFRRFHPSLLLPSISTDTEERRGGQPRCSSLKTKQEDVTRSPPNSLWAALRVLKCSEERRPESRTQAVGNWTVFICCWLLCWWFTLLKLLWLFEYVRSDASRSINQGHDESPPPVEICISCRHYHTGEFISLNVVYAVWIKPVVPAWCRDIKYIYRTNVGKIALTEIIETIFNSCLRKQEQDITSRRLLLWKI